MIDVSECLTIAQKWIKDNGFLNKTFVRAIVDYDNTNYCVVVCLEKEYNEDDLPFLLVDKEDGKISYCYFYEEEVVDKIYESKILFGELDLEEEN